MLQPLAFWMNSIPSSARGRFIQPLALAVKPTLNEVLSLTNSTAFIPRYARGWCLGLNPSRALNGMDLALFGSDDWFKRLKKLH